MKTKTFFILLLIVLMSCGTAGPKLAVTQQDGRPEWVDNATVKYPDSRFLTAIGIGDTRVAAEDNARGNISKIFQSNINLDQTLIENVKENESEFSKSMNMLTQTNVKSNQSLKNIKIGESWFNSGEGRYYVLAYLNRQETAMIYTEEMDQNTALAENAVNESSKSSEPFTQYAYLQKAQDALQINTYLESQLRIISPHSAYMKDTALENKVSQSLREAKNRLTCAVIAKGEMSKEISASMKEMLGKFGFPVVDNPQQAQLVFTADAKTEPTTLNAPGTYYLYNIAIGMKDKINNKTLETFTANGREGHVNESSALKRVSMAIDKKIRKDYYKKVQNYIQSYVQ